MDDFNVSSLHESRNEWGARLLNVLTPLVIDGYKSILDESIKLCKENGEMEKYLMTFQNLISRIPKWNSQIIETERKRIVEKSGCTYLEDLVTCIHIIQLKVLTAMRVGQKQKKIDINIPKLDDFIHKVYITSARKLYKNVYLLEINIAPLQVQKNYRELEMIIQECILNTIRESIPIENIIKAYMDETIEEDVVEEVKEQIIEKPILAQHDPTTEYSTGSPISPKYPSSPSSPSSKLSGGSGGSGGSVGSLSFNDIDYAQTTDGNVQEVQAPKSLERLEQISNIRAQQRQQDEDDDDDKIKISDKPFNLNIEDIENFDKSDNIVLIPDLIIDDVEIL